MKVSILGNSLTSLTLAKLLVNQDIRVDIYSFGKIIKKNQIQTIGISKTNIDFFNNNILNIKKLIWNIQKIEIYSENLNSEKILNFKNNENHLFSIIKNCDLYNYIKKNLKKNKLVKFKNYITYQNLLKSNYNLIFNCDKENFISKKFFSKTINKNYKSRAYITTLKHEKLSNNFTATQIFTKKGPLAFLPVSSTETSVVYSIKGKKNFDIKDSIKKHNTKYKILKINDFLNFELKASSLRSYYHKNIIAFGDMLHRLHPLAGQGFNMTIRDMKEIHRLIIFKKEHGLDLDLSLSSEFEKNMKDKNYLFSSGIDFIYEFFNLENKINKNIVSKSLKFLGKNKITNNFFTKLADSGLNI